MGLFKSMKDAMGEPHEAAAGPGGRGAAVAARDSLQGQAQEQNRILTIGSPGRATINGHVATGENVAGNPVWIFDIQVAPEGGAPYSVQKREIVSSAAMGGYADGASMACRIDPADPQKIAFGDQPFR